MSTIPKDVLETFPKKIYLQTTDEDECEPFIDNHEATWCTDRMHTSDVEYTRSDLASKTINEKDEEIEKWRNAERIRTIDMCEFAITAEQQASTIAALQADNDEWKQCHDGLKADLERCKNVAASQIIKLMDLLESNFKGRIEQVKPMTQKEAAEKWKQFKSENNI